MKHLEWPNAMLIPSILQMLDQYEDQSEAAGTSGNAIDDKIDLVRGRASDSQKNGPEITAAGQSLQPLSSEVQLPVAFFGGSNLEEVLRAFARFKKPVQSRFLDVFE